MQAEISKIDTTEILHPRVNLEFAMRELSSQEADSCKSCVEGSNHCHLTVMPNHQIGQNGELSGFQFTCHKDDRVNVLPLSKTCLGATCIY